jgi:Flp pilus assembly protein TadD
MSFRSFNVLLARIAGAVSIFLLCGTMLKSFVVLGSTSESQPAKITINYPLEGSVFPPEITPPNFLWHDPTETATLWVIEVSFAHRSDKIHIEAPGEYLQLGTIDLQAGPGINLSTEQASTRTWRPDAETWAKIKRLSVNSPATVTIGGFADANAKFPVSTGPISTGKVTISTSVDPVGAPVFYRDVPLLLPSPQEKGPIAPLPASAIPLIKWQIRNIGESQSHTVMGNLPTCANCHSFSRDGKTFGLDLDGPKNDKGLYALVPVEENMTIANRNVIRWSRFQVNAGQSNEGAGNSAPSVKRFGFMSQVSPDGRYVVTSIGPPDNTNTHQNQEPGFASGILDRLYSTNYPDIQFSQVFFPTRGVLAWYDKQKKSMLSLPGADDPQYVQTSAFWSPDGKYLIFSRALARDPYPPGVPKPLHANDPNETQIQYDLYKIPFNDGRGGKAVPVQGASRNGMSNDFPKVSPDGRWIVFVENKNGLLMRPDSRLFIVPFEGGQPRLMNCNLSLMNSWHTFSPNGRWLAFSSKARGPYTQLMLTHIDADGNDTPAIIVDNTTAANRAVNIPEFVNVPQGGLENIDPQATEFYRLFDVAFKQMENNQIPEAILTFRQAIERDPEDALTHYVLATALSGNDQESEAQEEYRKATVLDPANATFLDHLAVSLAINSHPDESVAPLQKAIALAPTSAEYRFNLGIVMESRGDFAGAVGPFEKAVELSKGKNWRALDELAKAYKQTGRSAEAIEALRQAIDMAVAQHEDQDAKKLRDLMDHYQRDSAIKDQHPESSSPRQ